MRPSPMSPLHHHCCREMGRPARGWKATAARGLHRSHVAASLAPATQVIIQHLTNTQLRIAAALRAVQARSSMRACCVGCPDSRARKRLQAHAVQTTCAVHPGTLTIRADSNVALHRSTPKHAANFNARVRTGRKRTGASGESASKLITTRCACACAIPDAIRAGGASLLSGRMRNRSRASCCCPALRRLQV